MVLIKKTFELIESTEEPFVIFSLSRIHSYLIKKNGKALFLI